MNPIQLKDLFTNISLMAAFDSILIGDLPSLEMQTAEDLLAEHSLLGNLISFGSKDANFGLLDNPRDEVSALHMLICDHLDWSCQDKWLAVILQTVSKSSARRLFTCQHKQLSMRQQGTYSAHVQAAEESDEDFFGNFS